MILREAIFDDWKIILDWRNDPTTRENSFNTEEVSELAHQQWFTNSLSNKKRKIYILEDNLTPVGSIRSDILDTGEYLLSWSIAPNQRGKGYGTKILKTYLKDRTGEFIAEIKPENIASIKMVINNDFECVSEIKYIKKQ